MAQNDSWHHFWLTLLYCLIKWGPKNQNFFEVRYWATGVFKWNKTFIKDSIVFGNLSETREVFKINAPFEILCIYFFGLPIRIIIVFTSLISAIRFRLKWKRKIKFSQDKLIRFLRGKLFNIFKIKRYSTKNRLFLPFLIGIQIRSKVRVIKIRAKEIGQIRL